MDYVELHLHDHYSALDGLNTPAEYMSRAKELGMEYLAQTNHGTLSGHREFQRAAKAAGITPILGVEAYISETDRFDRRSKAKREDGTQTFNHIGLIAANENGLRNLNSLMREAWTGGFYNKPRIDIDLLKETNEDIIVLSGCMNGLISKSFENEDSVKAYGWANQLKEIFGERFFIEIQGHNPEALNYLLLELAGKLDIKPVVTSDCHYARKEDLWIEEAMLILSTKPAVAKGFDFATSQTMDVLERFNYLYPDRKMTFQEIEIYLRSATEQRELLAKQASLGNFESAISNTLEVAKMIGDYPYYEALDLLPTPDASIKDLDRELERLVFEGLKERGLDNIEEYEDRALEELKVIRDKNFAVYFLILADIIAWARKQGIFIGPGRGSGVSSLVNYALHITNIDPLPYGLLFFRFMDPDRDDWPDIDVDFEVGRRYEVKNYAVEKYGHAANIMTFAYFKGKSAIKSAASVYKIPVGEVNAATSMLVDDPDFPVLESYEKSEATAAFRKKYPEVLPLAKALEGRIKSVGMHAGGTVLSKVPIEDYVPIQTAKDPQDEGDVRVPVVAVDMNDAANIGLIKYDWLGLNNLTVILDTINEIRANGGPQIDPYAIPLDDDKVYEMLSKGYTRAVFQCEGGPYTKLLVKMGGVANFDELVASNALVRPGASNSSIGKNFIKGKETGEFEYIHADSKHFTEETYGQILFQEQQMLLCTEVAGMSMRDANQVRQAIGKKKADKLAIWEPAFVEGMTKKVGAKKAQAVWDDLEKSAEYAFNKAHSVGYSLISYWTAWFKVNYPTEYMASVINHASGTDVKLKILFYLMEAKRLGIPVKLPHVNKSGAHIEVDDGAIRLGLTSVKYIADRAASKILDNAPFESYEHLLKISKTRGSGINSRAIDAMNKVGAATFPDNPKRGDERDYFYEYLNIPAFNAGDMPSHIKLQFRSLDEYTDDGCFIVCGMVYNIKIGQGWALVEMVDDSGSAGSFASQDIPIQKGQMYVMLIQNNRIARFSTTEDILDGKAGALGRYLDVDKPDLKDGEFRCIAFKTRTTRNGSKMADAVLMDRDKQLVSVAVFDSMINKAMVPFAQSMKIKPVFGETRSGGLYLKDLK